MLLSEGGILTSELVKVLARVDGSVDGGEDVGRETDAVRGEARLLLNDDVISMLSCRMHASQRAVLRSAYLLRRSSRHRESLADGPSRGRSGSSRGRSSAHNRRRLSRGALACVKLVLRTREQADEHRGKEQ
jgi:hypothetical protein